MYANVTLGPKKPVDPFKVKKKNNNNKTAELKFIWGNQTTLSVQIQEGEKKQHNFITNNLNIWFKLLFGWVEMKEMFLHQDPQHRWCLFWFRWLYIQVMWKHESWFNVNCYLATSTLPQLHRQEVTSKTPKIKNHLLIKRVNRDFSPTTPVVLVKKEQTPQISVKNNPETVQSATLHTRRQPRVRTGSGSRGLQRARSVWLALRSRLFFRRLFRSWRDE